MLDEKKWIFYGFSCNPIISSRLVLRFPTGFVATLNSSTTTPPFSRKSGDCRTWRINTGGSKCHFAHLVKLDDSPALAVLHPLEMRKYPLIHDLGMLSLGGKGSLKGKRHKTPQGKIRNEQIFFISKPSYLFQILSVSSSSSRKHSGWRSAYQKLEIEMTRIISSPNPHGPSC